MVERVVVLEADVQGNGVVGAYARKEKGKELKPDRNVLRELVPSDDVTEPSPNGQVIEEEEEVAADL